MQANQDPAHQGAPPRSRPWAYLLTALLPVIAPAGAAWGSNSGALHPVACRVTGATMGFDTINPLTSAQQHGRGEVTVACRNDSEMAQKVHLHIELEERQPSVEQENKTKVPRKGFQLSFSNDPDQTGVVSDANTSAMLHKTATISARSKMAINLQFHARLQLLRLLPAGNYHYPVNAQLRYDYQAMAQSPSPASSDTGDAQ
jgi:hypothetical protein